MKISESHVYLYAVLATFNELQDMFDNQHALKTNLTLTIEDSSFGMVVISCFFFRSQFSGVIINPVLGEFTMLEPTQRKLFDD